MEKINFYSHERQDEFVFNLLGNKGKYLELGGSHPIIGNNTYCLEQLGWEGTSFDIRNCEQEYGWSNMRKNSFSQMDVTSELFCQSLTSLENKLVDYISVDIDTAGKNYSLLGIKNILKAGITFKVLTFEHEYHYHGDSIKNECYNLLKEKYFRIFDNVALAHEAIPPSNYAGKFFEDWYVNLDYFDKSITNFSSKDSDYNVCIEKIKNFSNKKYENYNIHCSGVK